ncbi:hypothetical protein [Streptomyces sp. Da 82-17]|uniref:hypothetical protein n=1 Tax=Streptomyces sp. Da 82-17 TaxID=3377116 RepID=UPI0038D411BD
MMILDVEPAMWGVFAIALSLGLLALVAIYWSMPNPLRAETPPPLDRPGTTYTCYCYAEPVRVLIGAPTPVPGKARGRHARAAQWPLHHRIRPDNHVSHAGADGGGKGGTAPVPVAA